MGVAWGGWRVGEWPLQLNSPEEPPVSEGSPSRPGMPASRHLREDEMRLLQSLLRRTAQGSVVVPPLDSLEVQEMPDGGMGSLYVIHPRKGHGSRQFGSRVAEVQFSDADGVAVIASLNVDRDGDLFEIDIWRTDFRPLIGLPADL